jgi:hypothetical protein
MKVELMNTLLKGDLQITMRTLDGITTLSAYSAAFAEFPFESFLNSLLNDHELIEAILLKSDQQLRHVLGYSKDSQILDAQTVASALKMATVNGWIEGCKTILDADLMAYLDKDLRTDEVSLLKCSAGTNRLDMLQFWLSHRAKFKQSQLNLVGHVEGVLYHIPAFSVSYYRTEVIRLLLDHLVDVRHEIKQLMEDHGIEYCSVSARSNLPDAHARCMLKVLVREGIDVPQHCWPKSKSLYYVDGAWNDVSLQVFEGLEKAGFCEITQESFECSMETFCSPLLYLATRIHFTSETEWLLTQRNLLIRWFLSKGADLRETWPGSDTNA